MRRQLLTHFDRKGSAHMVDVGEKPATHRVAIASGRIRMQAATLRLIAAGRAKKGDVLGVARIAAAPVSQGSTFTPSGTDEQDALVGLLTVLGASKALDAGEEQRLIAAGWR